MISFAWTSSSFEELEESNNSQENSENCGPPPGNNFDLEVDQRSRSRHGVNGKG